MATVREAESCAHHEECRKGRSLQFVLGLASASSPESMNIPHTVVWMPLPPGCLPCLSFHSPSMEAIAVQNANPLFSGSTLIPLHVLGTHL